MAAVLSQGMHERLGRTNVGFNSINVRCPGRLLRGCAPQARTSGRSPSNSAQGVINAWNEGGVGSLGSYDAELAEPRDAPLHLNALTRARGGGAAPTARHPHGTGSDGGGGGGTWQEPVGGAHLSAADRAVLALARAATNLSDKAAVERTAAAQGLVLVTSSEVCEAPLLPPVGFTMEDDGEEGDGMAPSPPVPQRSQQAAGRSALRGGGRNSVPAHGARTLFGSDGAAAAATAASPRSGGTPRGAPLRAGGACADAASADERLLWLSRMVAEGAEVQSDEGEGEAEVVRRASAASDEAGRHGGILGAAAAALTRVARAASAATVVSAPVGHAAAGAAHAAQAAVATAARATLQMLPHYGEPSSSWLVADDPHGEVRYIVIAAGPDIRRRTARELTVDLVTFETYNLGVKVNRRLYEEAKALYARFMPLLMDYLEAVPDGNICFGGQGVGGSLAVMLQLMCVHRGLRFARLLPAVAVESPAVLAQVPLEHRRVWGNAGWEHERIPPQDPLEDVLEDLLQRSVLEELGLPQDAVRNLILPPQPSHHQSLALPLSSSSSGSRDAVAAAGPLVLLVPGSDAAAAARIPPVAQVFRPVGRMVNVQSVGSTSNRALLPSSAAADASAATGVVVLAPSATVSLDAVVEADGGSGEPAAAAAAAAAAFGAPQKRLDAATVGSIATAAATAAASAAVERLRFVGAGALRALASHKDRGGAAAATAATARPAPAVAVKLGSSPTKGPKAPKQHASWPSAVEPAAARLGVASEDDDDASLWGV